MKELNVTTAEELPPANRSTLSLASSSRSGLMGLPEERNNGRVESIWSLTRRPCGSPDRRGREGGHI